MVIVVGLALALSPLSAQNAGTSGEANGTDAAEGIRRDFVLDLPAGPPVSGMPLNRLTEEIADTIRCPQCQGLSVADSPSKTALAMKAEVRDMIAEGYSEEQILSYFEASYGEFIRLEPKAEGFNLVVWLAPFFILGGGVLALTARLRANARAVAAAEGEPGKDATQNDSDDGIGGDDEFTADDELDAYRARVRREVGS